MIALAPLMPTSAYADVNVNGYFSQAIISSPDNPYFISDSGTSFDYRELGVNGSWQVNKQLRLAAQVVSRKLGDMEDGSPKLDFALLDYNFFNSEFVNAGIRLGRVKNAYGFYNKIRDVPHARPGVMISQSIYFESMRDALLSVDGGEFYLDIDTSIGEVSLESYIGKTDLSEGVVEQMIYQGKTSGEYQEADVKGFKLSYMPELAPDLNLAVSMIDVGMDMENVTAFTQEQIAQGIAELIVNPGAFSKYVTGTNIDALLKLLSVQYSYESWVFTTEFLQIDIDITDMSVLYFPTPDRENILQGYYLQAEWLASEKFGFFARFDDLVYDKYDRKGIEYEARTGRNPDTQYTRSYTFGSRWYLTPDLSLTAEYSRNNGAATLIGPSSIDYSKLVKDWDLYVLQLSYHF